MRTWALFCLGLLLALPARAHDSFLMPLQVRAALGQPLAATLSSGRGLVPLLAPRRRRMAGVRLLHSAGGAEPVAWRRRRDHWHLLFRPDAAGVACLELAMAETLIELDDDAAEAYLNEVRPPEHVWAAWREQCAQGLGWRECYAKEAKSYLRVGSGGAHWRALAHLGHALEIVPLQDPLRLAPRRPLVLELRAAGRPLAGVVLRLFDRRGLVQWQRSDARGRVCFVPARGGPHLVATTTIAPPAVPGSPWHSRFATLGLHVGPARRRA